MRKSLLQKRGGSLRRSDGIDPAAGIVNLADVMLVFSCGLMVALVLNWNVQLNIVKLDPIEKQELTEDFEEVKDNQMHFKQGDSYEEMGSVYRDPVTGKLYLLTEENGQ